MSASSEYKQNYMRSIVYEAVARLLPVLGRDFNIHVIFKDDVHMHITIDATTSIGHSVKQVLHEKLQETIKHIQNEKEQEYGDRDQYRNNEGTGGSERSED